jgi:acetolactate synthase small subunit
VSQALLHVRVHDRPAALERLLGVLRRRGFAVTRVSTSAADNERLELVIRVDRSLTDPDRVRRELLTLQDVAEVQDADGLATAMRELLLVRLRPGLTDTHLAATDRPGVFEMIGSPAEIDAVLEALGSSGAMTGYIRSGEVAPPDEIESQTSESGP